MNWKPETPRVPNFIKVRLDTKEDFWPLYAFTDEQLRELGQKFAENLIKRSAEQREGANKEKNHVP